MEAMHEVKAMSLETWKRLNRRCLLIAYLRAHLNQEKIRAYRADNRIHDCNQQISVHSWLIDLLLQSFQQEHVRVASAIDAEFRLDFSDVTLSINGSLGPFAEVSTV